MQHPNTSKDLLKKRPATLVERTSQSQMFQIAVQSHMIKALVEVVPKCQVLKATGPRDSPQKFAWGWGDPLQIEVCGYSAMNGAKIYCHVWLPEATYQMLGDQWGPYFQTKPPTKQKKRAQ